MIVRQFLRFAWVGVLGFGVNGGVVAWSSPHIGPLWAQAVGFPLAATFTWWLNRHFTFGPSERSLRREWAYYVSANGIGWLANNGSYVLLVTQSALFHRYPVLAVAVGSVAGMCFNFGLSRYFVFGGGDRSVASVPPFPMRLSLLANASISVGATGRSPLLWLLVYPFLLKAPLWTGWFISDPLVSYGGLATEVGGRILSGLPTIDPNIAFTSDALGQRAALDWLHGKVPWWNPYEGTGTPLAAEMQSAALFLPFVLLYALPHGQLWFHLCLQVLTGWGTFFLLRRMGLGMLAAVTGGLLFEMNGTYAWLANAVINPICFLPWFLLGVEETVRVARKGYGIGWLCLPAALSLSLYAGFPEVAYINGLLVLIWVMVRFGQLQDRQRWRFLGWITLGGLAGILLSLPVVVPFLEYLEFAEVGGHGPDFGNAFLSRIGLPASVFPYIYGPIFSNSMPEISAWWGSVGGYFGMGLVVLAVFSLLGERERGLKIALLAWLVLGLSRTFGVPGIASGLNWLPMLEQAAFYRYVWPSLSMGLIVLAALAMDDLATRKGYPQKNAMFLWGVGLLLVLVCVPAWDLFEQLISVGFRERGWLVGSLFLGALVAGCLAYLFLANSSRLLPLAAGVVLLESTILFLVPVFAYPQRGALHLEGVQYLKRDLGIQRFYTTGPLAPNYGSAFGISQLNYNDLPLPASLVSYVLAKLDPYTHPILFIGNRHVDPAAPDPLQVLRERIAAFSKVGVSHIVVPPGESLETDKSIEASKNPSRSGLHLVHRDPVMNIYALDEFRDYFSAEGCRLRADGRNAVMAECDRPSRLVRLETFYPGWRAEVNGKPVPVEETEGLFQQVALPRGHAEIRFTYHPRFYAWIVAGFLSAWLILGLGFLWSRPKPPRRR
ncbi:MAG: GtrA family protein [Methylohalobius sp. ZOD2]|nr:GtrA family protein [Methylothermaceae bacterium]